jgi:hypothetical protein
MLTAETTTYGIPILSNVPVYSDSEYLPYCQSEKMMPNGRSACNFIEEHHGPFYLRFCFTESGRLLPAFGFPWTRFFS